MEHPSIMNTYQRLPFHEACDILESTDSLITEFIMDYCQFISPSDCQYLECTHTIDDHFYILAKVHKAHGVPAPSFHAVDCYVMASSSWKVKSQRQL